MRHTATSLLLAALAISACKSKGSPGPTEPGPTPAIALSISTGGATVVQGGTTPVSATLTRSGGFTGDVLLTVDGVPSGVTGSVSTPVTSGGTTSATITIAVAASTAPGTYSLTVRGTGSGVAAVSAPFTLTVTQAPDFSLAITPGSASVTQGLTSTSIAVTITRTNYTDPVALALGGTVPAGVTATFTTTSFTVTVGPATAPGVYNLSVTGTGTPGTKSTPFVLTVVAAGSFALAITPVGGVSVEQGTPNSSKTVTITRTNYTGSVTLTAENLPAGLTAEFDPNPTAANSSILTLTATGAVAPATYSITIRGTGPASLRAPGGLESLEATTTLAVTVTAPTGTFSLGLALSCGAITILQGAVDDSRVVTINRTSFAAPVGLAVDGLPAGLTAGFASSPTTGTTSRLTLTASAAVAPGSYNLTIRGTGPALLRAPGAPNAILASVPLTVTVAAGAAATPDVLDYDFATGLMGWAPGLSCPSQAQPDWGEVIVQEQMFVMNGRGPAGNVGAPNAWVSKVIAIPASATTLRFDVSGHVFAGSDARLRVRILDGGTSTIIFDQAIVGIPPARAFSTKTVDISAWAGKTVRIFFEQDDNGFVGTFPGSHEQTWLDNFHIGAAGPAPVLSSSCPGPRSNQSGGGTVKRRAQVFTVQHTGALTRATMEISGNPTGGDFILALRATDGTGKPVAPVLASATIFNVTPTNLAQNFTLDATFTSPPQVVSGQKYALSVEPAAGQNYFANGRLTGPECSTVGQRFTDPVSNEVWVFDTISPLLYSVFVTPAP